MRTKCASASSIEGVIRDQSPGIRWDVKTRDNQMHDDNSDRALGLPQVIVSLEPLSVPFERAMEVTGLPRTRLFDAVAKKQPTARKAGKATIFEVAELRRFIRSLPTRGRKSEAESMPA
jgi:hypothetical protein